MNCMQRKLYVISIMALCFFLGISIGLAKEGIPLNPQYPDRLPRQIEGRNVVPEFGCFLSLGSDDYDYKRFIDLIAQEGAFDVLYGTLRGRHSIIGKQNVVNYTKEVAEYALERYGIGLIIDADLRIARYDFENRRPDLLQERLLFKEVNLKNDDLDVVFHADNLSDHYTGAGQDFLYFVRGARLVKAWGYRLTSDDRIGSSPLSDDGSSILDVTDSIQWDREDVIIKENSATETDTTSNNDLVLRIDRTKLPPDVDVVTIAVTFRYSYPDIFADETLDLEKELYESYRELPFVGVGKDEWGFPPNWADACFEDFWYSEKMRDAYGLQYDGRDLVDDLFLTFRLQENREQERAECVDRFHKLCSDRVVEYEKQNYRLCKELWGKDSFVGVHTTWCPYPSYFEMRKNGLMWWKAPRDVAQTDEYVPFCIRNGMAKGTNSLWINMFYSSQLSPYVWEHWTDVASGGRVHIHQVYPRTNAESSPSCETEPFLLPIIKDAGVAKIRQKIRMLNLISNAPIDSPVAVIFSRFGAFNLLREDYGAIGISFCDLLAKKGYPADLIPIDEIDSVSPNGEKRWSITDDGFLQYGQQKYEAIVLYGESSSDQESYETLRTLTASVPDFKTILFSVDPKGTNDVKDSVVNQIVQLLEERNVASQTPWEESQYGFGMDGEQNAARPKRSSISRYLDGTILWVAATENDMGDPICLDNQLVVVNNNGLTKNISANATGIFAVRFNKQGELNAVVATELESFFVDSLSVQIEKEEIGDDKVDVALWRDDTGAWQGVFQREKNELPPSLETITSNWFYLQRR